MGHGWEDPGQRAVAGAKLSWKGGAGCPAHQQAGSPRYPGGAVHAPAAGKMAEGVMRNMEAWAGCLGGLRRCRAALATALHNGAGNAFPRPYRAWWRTGTCFRSARSTDWQSASLRTLGFEDRLQVESRCISS